MNELNVSNDVLNGSLITYNNDQSILGQLTSSNDVDIYKFQTTLLPTASGVGFKVKFSINESFDAQAGWKISLLDNSGAVISSVNSSGAVISSVNSSGTVISSTVISSVVDSYDVATFAASGELSLSSSYSSAKIAYVKVEKSGTNEASTAQYELIFEQHQQMSEEALTVDAVSLVGDVAHHNSFVLLGTDDTDSYLFETLAASSSSELSVLLTSTDITSATLTIRTLDNGTVFDSNGAAIVSTTITSGTAIVFASAVAPPITYSWSYNSNVIGTTSTIFGLWGGVISIIASDILLFCLGKM